ncbi:colanic acid biosynthesis glycosyl transferase WcaI [Pontibacter ummariensis]|uniref:Colanic acid biosynthesis glycosyl transferase WcaI n=1 Tax=Pontibacter ummariensis TaxID=1610492 RepID=A0A239K6N8_9BACT|nr:WcaI family glycosyltransferase [Pontibacter ummariensis]PRY06753.1 colanic acid biosynthesis glycosyl transferase WcaI [Pontibacter ummariensis]SNT13279.1 colanic acid biosynthesis glycosyl transferase WcaI [Pontibacter ummariensis]
MRRRILFIGYNYYPEPTGIGKYSGEMVAWLARKGYDCEVITSYPYYPHWRVAEAYSHKKNWYSVECQRFEGGSVKVNRCPMYIPSVPTGFKRMLLDVSFLISSFIKLLQLLFQKKFDYVVTVVPCFQFGLLGVFYKKIRKAMLLYHVQDLQIEAARDLEMIKSKIVLTTLFKLERYIFSQSDAISSISEGMVRKIRIKAKKDVYLFANWTDCKLFYPIRDQAKLREEFGLSPADKIVLYSGAIGEKQGLEAILFAAKALENHKELKFLICGSGPYKQKLCLIAKDLGLNNLVFFPIQPVEKFNLFLNIADVHLVIQKANASDLVMPSKLTTVLGVGGLALITAHKGTSLHSSVSQHNIGLLIEPENQQALNEAIWRAVTDNHDNIRKNARAYAEEHLSIEKIMEAYEKLVLKNCVEKENLLGPKQEPHLTTSLT